MILESAILLFTAIVSAVPEIAKNLLKAAPDIIKGLIQGLFNAVPTLLKSLKDILKSFLQAFKDFFGISSPSKEMAKQGGYIAQGLINGIKNLPEKARQIFQDLKTKSAICWIILKDYSIFHGLCLTFRFRILVYARTDGRLEICLMAKFLI